jgi:hypothetical protein
VDLEYLELLFNHPKVWYSSLTGPSQMLAHWKTHGEHGVKTQNLEVCAIARLQRLSILPPTLPSALLIA